MITMAHIEVIQSYFKHLQARNAASLWQCYASNIVYSDPVYGWMEGDKVKARWEYFCAHADALQLTWGAVTVLDDEYFTCEWTAQYTQRETGRTIKFPCKSFFRLKDYKIIEQSDAYRLSSLIAQTDGWKGFWFGWTGYMKRFVQKRALQALASFSSHGAR